MIWKTIVVGVDGSPAGVEAAQVGWELARMAGVRCRLVHVVRDIWASGRMGMTGTTGLLAELEKASRQMLEEALRGAVPEAAVRELEVRAGSPAASLRDFAIEHDAGLVVLGAKRHSAIARWLGGSTAKNVIRAVDRSVLVAAGPVPFQRVLVALDLSESTAPALAAAEEIARLCRATLRVLHAVEPVPYAGEGITVLDHGTLAEDAERAFRETVSRHLTDPATEVVVRRGPAIATIDDEAVAWGADLVVVGAHGRAPLERLLLGSVSEGVVNSLPASVLVVREPRERVVR
jgi:universal stress protein A